MREYGISIEDYDEILIEQEHCCAICKKHQSEFNKRLFVDHDHSTGRVRGLLCYFCNTILGQARDQIEILENGIKYLQKNNH